MLKDCYSTTVMIYKIPWGGQRLTELYVGFKVTRLHDQDHIHGGKNIVNPLFSGRRDLIVGEELISFNHVRMVYNNFKVDDHKLKIENIESIDHKKWASAQCIASRHVQRCLKEILSKGGRKKRTSSTETCLSIIANYIDIFVSYFNSLGKSVKLFKSPSFLHIMAMLGQRKRKY